MQDNPGRVVTKYQFSSLFSAAWYKAIRPENIISGFRKVGIYPFNSSAIAVPDIPSTSHMTEDVTQDVTGGDGKGDSESSEDENEECGLMEVTKSSDSSVTQTTFTPEQLSLFETRYENWYVNTNKAQ